MYEKHGSSYLMDRLKNGEKKRKNRDISHGLFEKYQGCVSD